MSPDEQLAYIEAARAVITGLAVLLGAAAGVVWYLFGRVERGCDRCDHCLLERQKEIDRRNVERDKNMAALGFTKGKRTSKVVPPKEKPPSDEDGDA